VQAPFESAVGALLGLSCRWSREWRLQAIGRITSVGTPKVWMTLPQLYIRVEIQSIKNSSIAWVFVSVLSWLCKEEWMYCVLICIFLVSVLFEYDYFQVFPRVSLEIAFPVDQNPL
jgi:hypothetical protein